MLRTGILVMALLAMLLVAGRAVADGTPTPSAEHGHTDSTPEAGHEHDHGERIPAGEARIRITTPPDGATLSDASIIVKVETSSWPLGEGKHWHLYVNGQAQGMSQGSNPSLQARDLKVGENLIEAVMSNETHQELDAVASITVRVVPDAAALAAPANSFLIIALIAGVLVIGLGIILIVRKV